MSYEQFQKHIFRDSELGFESNDDELVIVLDFLGKVERLHFGKLLIRVSINLCA